VLGSAGSLALLGSVGTRAAEAPLGDEIVRLWPGRPPGARAALPHAKIVDNAAPGARPDRLLSGIAEPRLVVFRPARPNGAAMLVIPGGGYVVQGYDNEGTRQAAWLNARGITAFILVYRLPSEGWANAANVPLQDAQRAVRLIRAGAARYGIAADRVGVMGFSAGGHLAGSLATRFAEPAYQGVDAADRLSARPDLAALIYPVITMSPPLTHQGSHDALIGADASPELCLRYSVDQRVTAETPPCFLLHTRDDTIVPVENSLLMYQAMLAAKRPVAMHLFESGGHGFGVNLPPSRPVSVWPGLLAAFAAEQGMIGG